MQCEECDRLLRRYREATMNFSSAVRGLADIKNATDDVYYAARERSERARDVAEQARLDLEKHTAMHRRAAKG